MNVVMHVETAVVGYLPNAETASACSTSTLTCTSRQISVTGSQPTNTGSSVSDDVNVHSTSIVDSNIEANCTCRLRFWFHNSCSRHTWDQVQALFMEVSEYRHDTL